IIVSWNVRDLLRMCLASIRDSSSPCVIEVIVIDNASSDDTASMVRTEFADVVLIEASRNLGFSGGNNVASGHAQGDLLLFLNPDTVVAAGAIDRLAAAIE